VATGHRAYASGCPRRENDALAIVGSDAAAEGDAEGAISADDNGRRETRLRAYVAAAGRKNATQEAREESGRAAPAARKDYKRLNPAAAGVIYASGGMQIELRWFIDAPCPWVYCNAVSVHILLLVLLHSAPPPSLVDPHLSVPSSSSFARSWGAPTM